MQRYRSMYQVALSKRCALNYMRISAVESHEGCKLTSDGPAERTSESAMSAAARSASRRWRRGIPLPEPVSQHDQFAGDEELANNEFIVLGQPIRQISVEVVSAVVGEPGSPICQRASAAIDRHHAALQQNDPA